MAGSLAATAAQAATPPPITPASFVGLPTCMLYARHADARLRVHAAGAGAVCTSLARQLGAGWGRTPRRAARILSPICRFADPHGEIELEVMDDAKADARGARICTNLARSGWLDLSPP